MSASKKDPAADVDFRDAVRTASPVSVGISGPSGAGKTYSGLQIAYGLADGGPVYVIDTENHRALQYADRMPYRFKHANLTAPFTPERYLFTVQKAVNAGAAAIVVDNMSHEHEGEGGCLEWHELELDRIAGDDWVKREKATWTAWIKPKAAHNRLVNYLEQVRCHLVLLSRAKEKTDFSARDSSGKIKPKPLGWTPIVGDRLAYFATLSLILPLGAEGRPDFSERSTKLDKQGFDFIRDQQQISIETGRALLAWSRGEDMQAAMQAAMQKGPKALPRGRGEDRSGPTETNRPAASPPTPSNSTETAPDMPDDADLIFTDAPTEDKHILGLRKFVAELERVRTMLEYEALVNAPERKKYLESLRHSKRTNLYAAVAPRITDAYERATRAEISRVA